MKDILLPNAAHNNTIAQAPIFEAFDDQWFKPLHDSSTPSCDEIIFFTCNLKFDQTYAIAHRIATKEFFKSCLEAKEAHKVDTLGCEDLCEMDYTGILNSNAPLYMKDGSYLTNCVKECRKPIRIPECGNDLYVS